MPMINRPIFIHGILPRSGTNFLNHILLLHPDCIQPVTKIRENYFLHHSDSLWQYSEQLFQTWSNPRWKGEAFSQQQFFSMLGEVLLSYLFEGLPNASQKVLVSKTPSVQHIERCFDLFPDSRIILIVRDARDVAASSFKSWGHPILETLDKWTLACQSIVRFEKIAPSDRYLLLRYEDLMAERERWTRTCLKFLELDDTTFLWDDLKTLPIFGSSEAPDWKTQEVTPDFKPVGRWRSLPLEQRQILESIQIPSQAYFGYGESANTECLPLPPYAERLQQPFLASSQNKASCVTQRRVSRITKFRKGMRLLAEALVGEYYLNAVKKQIIKRNG